MEDHSNDSDCTIDPATGCCVGCGVYQGDPCPTCGGRGYHVDGCREIEPTCESCGDSISQDDNGLCASCNDDAAEELRQDAQRERWEGDRWLGR